MSDLTIHGGSFDQNVVAGIPNKKRINRNSKLK